MSDLKKALLAEITQIWSHVLAEEPLGVGDDFFVQGGDSLQLVNLVASIGQRFGIDFNYERFLEKPTLGRLVELVAEAKSAQSE